MSIAAQAKTKKKNHIHQSFGSRAFDVFNVIFMSTIRAGGDSVFLMFLDCGIVWLVGVPLAFLSVYAFQVTSIAAMFAIIQCEQLVRMLIGYRRYKQGKWCRNLTAETQG